MMELISRVADDLREPMIVTYDRTSSGTYLDGARDFGWYLMRVVPS